MCVLVLSAATAILSWWQAGCFATDPEHFTWWYNTLALITLVFLSLPGKGAGRIGAILLAIQHPLAATVVFLFWATAAYRLMLHGQPPTDWRTFPPGVVCSNGREHMHCTFAFLVSLVHHLVVPLFLWADLLFCRVFLTWRAILGTIAFCIWYLINITIFSMSYDGSVYDGYLDLHRLRGWMCNGFVTLVVCWYIGCSLVIVRIRESLWTRAVGYMRREAPE